MSVSRIGRINEEVKKELSAVIRELKDPRIGVMTSVVAAEVTRDMRWCKAFVSVMGTEQERQDTLKGLRSAAGFVRRALGARLGLRYTPEIVFELDSSIAHGAHINQVLHEIGTQGGDKEC